MSPSPGGYRDVGTVGRKMKKKRTECRPVGRSVGGDLVSGVDTSPTSSSSPWVNGVYNPSSTSLSLLLC